MEEEGFVTTIHGKGTFVTASDKQLAVEARKRAVEEEFDKAIDKAVSVGMNQNEILELVQLLLDENKKKGEWLMIEMQEVDKEL